MRSGSDSLIYRSRVQLRKISLVSIGLMHCPYCQHTESRVLESRSTESGQSIRRRRECLNCQHRFTTYERIEFVPITILKRDNSRESFDRSKLIRGIIRACEKTDVSHQKIEEIVDDLEARLQQNLQKEFHSSEIGELVLEYLQKENEVAYIRFASVYRKFQGIKDFIETLACLQNRKTDENQENCLWEELDIVPASKPAIDCLS